MRSIIREEQARGCTIFLTTHHMFTADELCDRIGFINAGELVAIDSPRNLKLQYGQQSVKVEYAAEGEVRTAVYFLDHPADLAQFQALVAGGQVQTIHSQEATLEEIFLKLTGRGLG